MADHSHHHSDGHNSHDRTALADLLDLDAEVLGGYLDEVIAWAGQFAPAALRTIVDVGAGTGTGSLALARHFSSAEVLAIDKSAPMLERIQAAAGGGDLTNRVRTVQADLDVSWPRIGGVDLVWAASSLHEVADPDQVLGDIYHALNPGGLLVVVEMASLPRFLPDDVGRGRPGLEQRCHTALAQAGWNSFPNWTAHLERSGFAVAAQRSFTAHAESTAGTRRYAHGYLGHLRSALNGKLAADDLYTLDRLLAGEAPHGLLHRSDLRVQGNRIAWAARRP